MAVNNKCQNIFKREMIMEERKKPREGQIGPTDIGVLKGFPFFKNFEETHLQKVLENAVVIQYEPSQTIIRTGEMANSFFIILNGLVNVGIISHNKFISIQTLKTGNLLGWSWIIPPFRWRFDAIALERTRILMLDGTYIRNLCEQNHDLGYELMKRLATVLAGRLESTRSELIERRTHI